jgi:hypothetical protein
MSVLLLKEKRQTTCMRAYVCCNVTHRSKSRSIGSRQGVMAKLDELGRNIYTKLDELGRSIYACTCIHSYMYTLRVSI